MLVISTPQIGEDSQFDIFQRGVKDGMYAYCQSSLATSLDSFLSVTS